MKRIPLYTIVLVFFISVWACEVDSECGTVNVDFATFGYYEINDDGEAVLTGYYFDSVKIAEIDSAFYVQDTLTEFRLPLNVTADTTAYYFYKDGEVDTLIVSYEKINRIDSPECGIELIYSGLDTVRQTFDSLVVRNDTLNRLINGENIRFFNL